VPAQRYSELLRFCANVSVRKSRKVAPKATHSHSDVRVLGCWGVCVSAWRSNLRWWGPKDIRIRMAYRGAHVKPSGRSPQIVPPERGALSTNLAGTVWMHLAGVTWALRPYHRTVGVVSVGCGPDVEYQSCISQNNSNNNLVFVDKKSQMDKHLLESMTIRTKILWLFLVNGLVH